MAECALNGSLGGIAAKALLIANTAPSSPSATGLKGLPITGILRAALRCQGFPQTTVSGRVRPLGLRGGANRHSFRCTRAWSGIPSRNIGGSRSCLPPGSGRKKDRAQADRNRHQLHPPPTRSRRAIRDSPAATWWGCCPRSAFAAGDRESPEGTPILRHRHRRPRAPPISATAKGGAVRNGGRPCWPGGSRRRGSGRCIGVHLLPERHYGGRRMRRSTPVSGRLKATMVDGSSVRSAPPPRPVEKQAAYRLSPDPPAAGPLSPRRDDSRYVS